MLALPQEARVGRRALALSPDGSRLIYVAERGTASELFQLTLEDAKGGVLAGTEGAFDPFFSPDAKWIGFYGRGSRESVAARDPGRLVRGEPSDGR